MCDLIMGKTGFWYDFIPLKLGVIYSSTEQEWDPKSNLAYNEIVKPENGCTFQS